MINAQTAYALNHEQIANLIMSNPEDAVMIQGEMGIGKTAVGHTLAQRLPTHKFLYLDFNNMGAEDAFVPNFKTIDERGVVSMVPNEQLGLHLEQPVILMMDEYGKGNISLKNSMTRILNEAEAYGYKLHPDSLRFATTNLGAEGVGDILFAHQRNRVTMVTMAKPSVEQWLAWGINNNVNPAVLGWVRETPQCLHSFAQYTQPDENQYIHHPKSARAAFVTPRSLARAGRWVDKQSQIDEVSLTAALIGTVGERAALDMSAWIQLSHDLPKLVDIKERPHSAHVPSNASAICMVVYRVLGAIERDWVDAWMDYMQRLPLEAQSLFVNNAREDSYSKRNIVMQSSKFGAWALKNNALFSADKK
jgi:hypothetical protein